MKKQYLIEDLNRMKVLAGLIKEAPYENYKNLNLNYDNYEQWRNYLADEDEIIFFDKQFNKVKNGERTKEQFQDYINSELETFDWKTPPNKFLKEPKTQDTNQNGKENIGPATDFLQNLSEWDKYWYEGFYDITRALHSENRDAYSNAIYEALKVLNKTNGYTLESFKEYFANLLDSSFLASFDSRYQHDAILRGIIKDAIDSIADKVARKDNTVKPN